MVTNNAYSCFEETNLDVLELTISIPCDLSVKFSKGQPLRHENNLGYTSRQIHGTLAMFACLARQVMAGSSKLSPLLKINTIRM